MFSLTFGKRLSFVYLEVCSLYSVVCLSLSTLEESSLLMWIALFPSLPLLMVFSFVSTLPFYLSMYMPLAEHWSCLYVVPVDILVHISLAEVGDFLRGMFAAVEWLEWVQGYAQLFKKVQFTPPPACTSVPVVSFLPPHFVFAHFTFFASNFFWGKQ